MAFIDWWTRLRARPARRAQGASYRLSLEPLEDRTVPATIHWIAGSGDFNVGSNWSGGVVPGPSDVAVIDTGSTAATITIQPTDNIVVQAVNTASADTLSFNIDMTSLKGGALTVTAGSSTLNGPLSIFSRASLTATGSGVRLTANGTVTLNGGNLSANGGAQMSFPAATSYQLSSADGATLRASGPGSTLAFGALTSFAEPENANDNNGGLNIKAEQGGQVQLPALSTMGPGPDGVFFSADGPGSTINVSALSTFNRAGTLSATNGATVLAGALTKLNGVKVTLDAASTLPMSQWTAFTLNAVIIDGRTETFPILTNIDGSGFFVSGGAQVSLPAVRSYAVMGFSGLGASGSGSSLTLSALTSIASTNIGELSISAAQGGRVQLPALTAVNPNGGGFPTAPVLLSADGAGSTIDMPALTTFRSGGAPANFPRFPLQRSITVTHGGTLLVGALTDLALTGLLILDGTGTFNASGPINLGGVRLSWTYSGATPPGTTIAIVNTTGGVTGTFKLLPEGAVVTEENGSRFSISYQANGGKTVLMTQLAPGVGIRSFFPTSSVAGTSVTILGTRFTGTLGVSFGGVAAQLFTVNADTVITATVPVGAKSGPISVSTPSGTGVSNANFSAGAIIVTGADAGGGPQVKVFDASTGQFKFGFFAYDQNFTGGVRVAVGDVNGDGVPDIVTAPGPGGGPDIHVYDGITGQLIRQFFAFDPNFTGGSFVAVGDVTGYGFGDIVVGADAGGGPNVSVFSGKDLGQTRLLSFFPYDPGFTGGVRVAAGDVEGVGVADIVTGAGPGGGPNVTVYQFNSGQAQMLQSYFAYDMNFTAGVYVAAGDVNGFGDAGVIVGAGAGGGPNVVVFNGSGVELASFFPYDAAFTGGVRVAGIVTGAASQRSVVSAPGPGGGPDVRIVDRLTGQQLNEFFAYSPAFTGGLYVAAGR